MGNHTYRDDSCVEIGANRWFHDNWRDSRPNVDQPSIIADVGNVDCANYRCFISFLLGKDQKDGSHAMKNLLLLVALSLTLFSFSCEVFERATPIPKEKEAFIGVWLSQSGYKLHIKAAGTATITQLVNSHDPDFDSLNIKVAPPIIEDILVKFKTDSILMVIKPLVYAKEFRIDRYPYHDGDLSKIVLNGVTLIKKLE